MKVKTGLVSVDSTKYRIELDKLESYDLSLLDNWAYVNTNSGEHDEKEFKLRAKRIEGKGYSTKVLIEKNIKVSQDRTADCLVILMSSKLLESRYFEGITESNIKIVYDKLMSYNLFKCSLETFLKEGCLTDCDLKLDEYMNLDTFEHSVKVLKDLAKPSKTKDKGYRPFNDSDNKGIEFSKRESSAYKTNPFVKMYHKGIELKNKSKEFKNNHLSHLDTDNIARLETTVKNKTHFKSLGVNDTSLLSVLRLPGDTKKKIISQSLQSHLEGFTRIKTTAKNPNKMTPNETIICQGLIIAMEGANMTYESAESFMLLPIHNRTEKSRKKQQIKRIYLSQIKGQDLDKKVIKMNSFLRMLGVAV
jgi:hypothetical protein